MAPPAAQDSRQTTPADAGRLVTLGRITGAYGVRGWVKIHSETMPREAIVDYAPWYLGRDGQWTAARCIEGRRQGKGLAARLEGIDDREAALALTGCEIAVQRDQFSEPLPGEYYWVDIEGLEVVTLEGTRLGVIDHLFETGANDVMVVVNGRQRLIPFVVPQVVREVDFAARRVVVDWDADF